MLKYQFCVIGFILLSLTTLEGQSWKGFYDEVKNLDEDNYLVKRFDKYGVVDLSGKVVISIKYDTLIAYPKGFIAQETTKDRKLDLLLAKSGNVLYQASDSEKFFPFDHAAWSTIENGIPIAKLLGAVVDATDYHQLLPYEYKTISLMGENSSLFLVENEKGKWAIIDSSNQLKTDYIYTHKLSEHDQHKEIIEPLNTKTTASYYYNNWLLRKDTLVCVSTLDGKELWKSKERFPARILYCGNGIHLIEKYSVYGRFTIIDEVTQSVVILDPEIEKVHTYLGKGTFYVSMKDNRHGVIDVNGNFQKEYPYTAVKPIPSSSAISGLSKENVDFGDYVYAMNENGTVLWSPKNNHSIEIDKQGYEYQTRLRPFAKSKRYWVLIESEDFSKLYEGAMRTPITFSKLVICDSITGKIVYTKSTSRKPWGIRPLESAPDQDIWVLTNHYEENSNRVILFNKGKVTEYSNDAYCSKLSPDGRFYKIESEDFGGYYSRARVFDTQKGYFIKKSIYDAIYFGDESKARFIIQESSENRDKTFYLADLEGNKIKSIVEPNLSGMHKISGDNIPLIKLTKTLKNTTKTERGSTTNYERKHGVIDLEGNLVLPIKYGNIRYAYQKEGKYAFVIDASEEDSDDGLIIPIEGESLTWYTGRHSGITWFGEYLGTAADSTHYCIFNLETGKVSPKFDNIKSWLFSTENDDNIYVFYEKRSDGSEKKTIYNASTFEPILHQPYQSPRTLNKALIVDFKTGKKRLDWHYTRFIRGNYCVVYKYIEQVIDWNGKCIKGCQ